MESFQPFVKELALRAQRNAKKSIKFKLRTLLNGFGYYRRTEGVLANIHRQLSAGGLSVNVSMTAPPTLDDPVTVRISGSVPQAAAPVAPPPVTLPPATAAPSKFDELVEAAEATVTATVEIFTRTGLGSGFIIHPDGLILTAAHVVEVEGAFAERKVRVKLSTGKQTQGIVVRAHRALDFALLWLREPGPFPTISLGNPKALRYGQTVLAVGSPYGLSRTVTRGIVSNPKQVFNRVECIQTDAPIDHGNSGGPLVGGEGAVGIIVWGLGDVDSARFAIPIDYLQDEIETALQMGKDRCSRAPLCPACGFIDFNKPTWYCRNCGAQIPKRSRPAPKEA